MASNIRPRVLDILKTESNSAADAAIAEALTHVEDHLREPLFRLLLQRGHTPSLSTIIGKYHEAHDNFKRCIHENLNELSAAIRAAIDSSKFTHRAGAIELIVQSNESSLIPLLADALRSKCPRTNALAATALHIFAAHVIQQSQQVSNDEQAANVKELENHTISALKRAMRIWDKHTQPKALEAAMWLAHRLSGAFQTKLRDPRSKISDAIKEILEHTTDPKLAGFTMHALAMPSVRSIAAKTIAEATDLTFIQALIQHGDLSENREIRQGCQWIRNCGWIHRSTDYLLKLKPADAKKAVQWLSAIGGASQKFSVLHDLTTLDDQTWPRAVFAYLKTDQSPEATELLTQLAFRGSPSIANNCTQELKRRYGAAGFSVTRATSSNRSDPFDLYMQRYDQLSDDERKSLVAVMKNNIDDVFVNLRTTLATAQPLQRICAVQLIHPLGLVEQLSEQIYRLCHDLDPLVRCLAIKLLIHLPNTTTQRLLRSATADPNPRVQATAIEVMDQLEDPQRDQYVQPLLASPDNRVRANAILSMLRLGKRQAGDALIHMLEHDSRAHRLSGLWVIENLQMNALSHRVDHMMQTDPDSRIRLRAKAIREQLTSGLSGHTDSSNMFTGDDNADELLLAMEGL